MRIVLMGAAAAAFIVGASAASAQETQTYAYDVHGRLTAVTRTTASTTRTTTYTLDKADNRTSRLLGAPTASAAMAAPDAGDVLAADAPAEMEEAQSADDGAGASSDTATDVSPDQPAA